MSNKIRAKVYKYTTAEGRYVEIAVNDNIVLSIMVMGASFISFWLNLEEIPDLLKCRYPGLSEPIGSHKKVYLSPPQEPLTKKFAFVLHEYTEDGKELLLSNNFMMERDEHSFTIEQTLREAGITFSSESPGVFTVKQSDMLVGGSPVARQTLKSETGETIAASGQVFARIGCGEGRTRRSYR